MDPISTAVLLARPTVATVPVAPLYWEGSYDSSVTVAGSEPASYTVLGNSNGSFTYSNTLPGPRPEDYFFDVNLLGGFSSSPTQVAWLGVTNATSAATMNGDRFVGWYWSGDIWRPATSSGPTGNSQALEAGRYRIQVNAGESLWQIWFLRLDGTNLRGPITFSNASGTSLRLMMMGQSGFRLPVAAIIRAPDGTGVFSGGGDLTP